MKLFPPLLGIAKRDFAIIKAHAAGPRRISVAIEVFEHSKHRAATAVVLIELDTLATELVGEVDGSSIDYACNNQWHGLAQRDAVVELGGKKPVVTKAKAGRNSHSPLLTGLARVGDATYVSGTSYHQGYRTNGFVARVAGGKLEPVFDTVTRGECGPMSALCAGKTQLFAAGGYREGAGPLLYNSNEDAGIDVPCTHIRSLYETADGVVLIGGTNGEAAIVSKGKVQAVTGGAMEMVGMAEYRGVEYWAATDGQGELIIYKRSKTKLTKAWKTKAQWAGYRHLDGAPNARITASKDLLVVSNVDRLHVYDGKVWTQLGLQPNPAALFKRLPVGMKR